MKILVVDDDDNILRAVSIGLQFQWQDAEVITARDGDSALKIFFDQAPDIILLDINLPLLSGFSVLQEIRRVSEVPVILLTARTDDVDLVRGLSLGASDYVTKPFGHLALLARIKAVMRRTALAPTHGARAEVIAGDLKVDFESRSVTVGDERVTLTPLEYRLLYHLVRNPEKLMTHEALVSRVWGPEHSATSHQLKVFISRLRAKIERPGRPPLIQTEHGLGYRFVQP